MTCIAAVVKDGHVWMAGDLLGSNGFTKKVYPDTKVFVNGDFILGFTSSFRMGQILQYNWQQPPRLEGMADREYIQTDVIESFRSCLNDFGFGEMLNGEHQGGNFLIGYKGCLYEMQNNFSILKNENLCAIGSGQYHAEAVLKVLTEQEDYNPAQVLERAIQVASQFVTSVSEEYTICSTDEEAINKMVKEDNLPELTKEYLESLSKEKIIAELFGEGDEFDREETLDISVIDDIEILKGIAYQMEIKYPHNIGIEKLRSRIAEYIENEG